MRLLNFSVWISNHWKWQKAKCTCKIINWPNRIFEVDVSELCIFLKVVGSIISFALVWHFSHWYSYNIFRILFIHDFTFVVKTHRPMFSMLYNWMKFRLYDGKWANTHTWCWAIICTLFKTDNYLISCPLIRFNEFNPMKLPANLYIYLILI